MAPIIPVPDSESILETSNLQLPKGLWKKLDAIEHHENQKEAARAKLEDRLPIKMSRTKVIRHFLEWASRQYGRDEGDEGLVRILAEYEEHLAKVAAQAEGGKRKARKKR